MGLQESHSQLIVVTKQWTTASIGLELGSSVNLFVADRSYQVVSVTERHSTIGSTTVMLVGALQSTPVGSAANLLASTIPTTGPVNVTNFGTLFGSAVLTSSTVLGTTAVGPVLGSGDALGLLYSNPANLLPVGVLQVILQTI